MSTRWIQGPLDDLLAKPVAHGLQLKAFRHWFIALECSTMSCPLCIKGHCTGLCEDEKDGKKKHKKDKKKAKKQKDKKKK
jgi:hypothetical protein